jgi:hypothetical protein
VPDVFDGSAVKDWTVLPRHPRRPPEPLLDGRVAPLVVRSGSPACQCTPSPRH